MKFPSGRNEPPFLMVGGPADGKFVDTENNRFAVPKSKAAPVLEWDNEYAENVAFEVTEYVKKFWIQGSVVFFVPIGQTEEETLRLLIQGYHQPKEKK